LTAPLQVRSTESPQTANHKYPLLAREGWPHSALALALAVVVHYFAGWAGAAPFWLFSLFVLQFFRDPVRYIASEPGAVVSPADGRVIAVGEAYDPYLRRPALRVSIFMNVFNVHSNFSPVTGVVQQRWYSQGKFFNAVLDKASEENERNALWIKTDDGEDIVVVQVAGLIARRILCYVAAAHRLNRGDRYGFIRFGSRVDIYVPPNSKIGVGLGDKVKAGSDIVGILLH
jgi:phosphatidylserine decarboxylase